ncbi:MAG TPA: maleylacetate reductase and hydroxyquinol 1,2-dioxygenase domain-containing protein [Pseudonocardiaceae bacterium]|nr:maleylacetate reductase and hydroxyquinol 1,2-dioxygenase domain-containing protein [Pseudonocardiaceae bacterium]
MRSFVYSSNASRIVFGSGTVARVGAEVARLGGTKVLVLSGPRGGELAGVVTAALGGLVAGRFDGAAMHTPVDVTERALAVLRECGADCLVAVGGGSTTGLAKALALRTDLPQVVIATTYAGSEVTPVIGETDAGRKTTRSSPAVLPETVIYDVDLTLSLPVGISVTSAVNAMAHAVEALYSPQANPVTDGMALTTLATIAGALPDVVARPPDPEPRAALLEGAWLAGTCLGTVGMGLHHKLAHVLGGTFGLPHAETHTVLLPHVMAYNAPAAPEAFARMADALGVPDAAAGVFDLVERLSGPTSLRELGMAEADIERAADEALALQYPNPREPTREGIRGLLTEAWHGRRPGSGRPDARWLTDQVVASFAHAPDRVRELVTGLVRHLHRFVTDHDVTDAEWSYAIDFLTRTGQISGPTRQEFVLLSDTLGVSSVVDLLTNSRTADTTPSAVLGPFYVDGPPPREHGDDIADGLPGTPLWVDVRVTGPNGDPVADAVVDVWQSDADGYYDVQLPDQDGPVLRARFHTDADGRLRFWTIVPREYPIPADGPVGQMLDAVGRHPYRAPHVHFMIGAPGFRRLVTQLFVAGGKYLDSDTVFGVKPELVVDFVPRTGPTPDGRAVATWSLLTYTFRITPLRIVEENHE